MLDLGRGAPLVPELEAFATTHPCGNTPGFCLPMLSTKPAARSMRWPRCVTREPGCWIGSDWSRRTASTVSSATSCDTLRTSHPHLGTRPAASAHPHGSDGTYTRLRSMSTVARAAAVTGGTNLVLAQEQRAAAVAEAERTDDPGLTARVIAAYDVPTIWTRSDDPHRSEALVAATRHSAPTGARGFTRASRTSPRHHRAGASRKPRRLGCRGSAGSRTTRPRPPRPRLLVLALNARFVQSFQHPGRTGERDVIAGELIDLSTRHDLPMFETLGHLIKIQVCAARGDTETAQRHVETAERLAGIHETPLVHVLTAAFRAMRLATRSDDPRGRSCLSHGGHRPRRRRHARSGSGPLAACASLTAHAPSASRAGGPRPRLGPYRPWAQPLLDLARGNLTAARNCRRPARTPRPTCMTRSGRSTPIQRSCSRTDHSPHRRMTPSSLCARDRWWNDRHDQFRSCQRHPGRPRSTPHAEMTPTARRHHLLGHRAGSTAVQRLTWSAPIHVP